LRDSSMPDDINERLHATLQVPRIGCEAPLTKSRVHIGRDNVKLDLRHFFSNVQKPLQAFHWSNAADPDDARRRSRFALVHVLRAGIVASHWQAYGFEAKRTAQ